MARQISLKYAGYCRGCSRSLACGSYAWWEQGRGVACLSCGASAIDGYRRSGAGRVIAGQVVSGGRGASARRADLMWGSDAATSRDPVPQVVTVHLWRDESVSRWVWSVVAPAAVVARKSGLARTERAARRRALRRYSYHLRRGWSPGGLFEEMPGREERIKALEAEVFAPINADVRYGPLIESSSGR